VIALPPLLLLERCRPSPGR